MIISLHSRGGGAGRGRNLAFDKSVLMEVLNSTNSPTHQCHKASLQHLQPPVNTNITAISAHAVTASIRAVSPVFCIVMYSAPALQIHARLRHYYVLQYNFQVTGNFFFRISSISQYRTQNNHLAVTAMQVQTEIGCFIQLDTVSVHLTIHTHTHIPIIFFCGGRSHHVESVCC